MKQKALDMNEFKKCLSKLDVFLWLTVNHIVYSIHSKPNVSVRFLFWKRNLLSKELHKALFKGLLKIQL